MRKTLLFVALCFMVLSLSAETKTATGTGYWDAITWSPAGEPQSGDDVVIPDGITVIINDAAKTVRSIEVQNDNSNNDPGILKNNYPLTVTGASSTNSLIDGKLEVNNLLVFTESNLTVGDNGIVTIFAGKQLVFASNSTTIANTGAITLNSSSALFSSLIYRGSSSVNVTYKRSISGVDSAWDLIGSPVVGESASDIIAQTALASNGDPEDFGIGEYNNSSGATGTWTTFDNDEATFHGTLPAGKGYQMATDGAENSEIDFSGTLNTSTVSRAITEGDQDGDAESATGTRFNLFANPYTAYVSVNSNASSAASYGTTHLLTPVNLARMHANNQGVYVWNGSSYTTIGTSTPAANAVLAPGQGFMIGGKYGDGSVNFDMALTAMTEDGTDDAIANDIMVDDDRAELFISLSQNDIERHTELYFLDDGSDNFTSADVGGLELNYNSISTRVVSGENDLDLAIQTLAHSEMWDKIIPISLDVFGGEEMTISISHRTTPADLNIYLEDTEEGTMTNLLDGDFVYTPASDLSGVGRFFIHMTADTMSNGEVSTSMLNAYKETDASYITIEGLATQSNETKVSLYNILGREVLSTTLNNNMGTQTISTVGLSAGIYVIELESGSDRLTKKLLIQ